MLKSGLSKKLSHFFQTQNSRDHSATKRSAGSLKKPGGAEDLDAKQLAKFMAAKYSHIEKQKDKKNETV